jgi:hypothetical protein
MLKIENTEVYGWEAAIRGMRNPKNSWDKSDSDWYIVDEDNNMKFIIGPNDLKLMQTLAKAGDDHGKFLRMLTVTCDVVAPLYFFKEYDTYKIGTVADSCSTMHKIHAKEFTLNDFSHEWLSNTDFNFLPSSPGGVLVETIVMLNKCRKLYLETKDKEYWYQMIQLLPTSYNQRRTVQLNYQVLKNMYHARKNHKLTEWHTLCDWMETLPYFKELCIQE